MFGVDVSKWNGSNDFYRAKKSGVEFVIIRSNYGYNNNFQKNGYDQFFEENYSRAKNSGLPIGVYCYNYAQTIEQVKEEAKRTLNCLYGKTVDIAVFCDAEDNYFLKGDNVTEKIIAYLKIIKDAGYPIGVYANLNWFNNYIDLEKIKKDLGDVITWIAHYNSKLYNANQNHYKGKYDIWQFGSEGYTVDGISNFGSGISYVDVNHSYRDFSDNKIKGWINTEKGWWYRNADGTYIKNKWLYYEKNWYYFNDDGYALKNQWFNYNNNWYYFNEDCKMINNQFLKIREKTYYFDEEGISKTNYIKEIDGKLYAFNYKGELIKDKKIDENGVIK